MCFFYIDFKKYKQKISRMDEARTRIITARETARLRQQAIRKMMSKAEAKSNTGKCSRTKAITTTTKSITTTKTRTT